MTDSTAGPLTDMFSHPDLNQDGTLCFYAADSSGERGVFRIQGGELLQIARSCGPLGPTINEASCVAFRAVTPSGAEEIMTYDRERTVTIATVGSKYACFHGLPVIRRDGAVAFRADLRTGGQGVYVGDGVQTIVIAETGTKFNRIGFFPIMNDAGAVAFCASLSNGQSGVFVALEGDCDMVVSTDNGFESFRGALINNDGHVVFYATPCGGSLGIYSGPNPERDCLLSVGSSLFGSPIADFALNPVSINDAGQLAIRAQLEDHRQVILRADPARVR